MQHQLEKNVHVIVKYTCITCISICTGKINCNNYEEIYAVGIYTYGIEMMANTHGALD